MHEYVEVFFVIKCMNMWKCSSSSGGSYEINECCVVGIFMLNWLL